MEISNIRNLYHIHRNKVVLFLAFSLFALNANAQLSGSGGNYNYFEFQKKPFYFGISLGINSSGYRIDHSKNFVGNDSINIAESDRGPGFHLHIITNMKIGNHFDFRILPGFSFAERTFEFTSAIEDGQILKRSIESVFFDIPLQLRFKSDAYKDKKAFVIAGLKYAYDVQSNSKTRQSDNLIKISPHDFQIEVGAGMQFFFPYFIFSPEIKFSRGISNILIYNDNLNESKVLEQLGSQIFSISFHFEG